MSRRLTKLRTRLNQLESENLLPPPPTIALPHPWLHIPRCSHNRVEVLARPMHVFADALVWQLWVLRLGRPGHGDEILESARDYAVLLKAQSASPPGSGKSSREFRHQTSFDPIMDEDPRSSGDSVFGATGQRASMFSDFVLTYNDHHPPSQGLTSVKSRALAICYLFTTHSLLSTVWFLRSVWDHRDIGISASPVFISPSHKPYAVFTYSLFWQVKLAEDVDQEFWKLPTASSLK
ncbi:hypothetical protein BD410DRAFT_835828 [Rickenella mellea]|uniref:Uncharacterized protein n=1 Tax=Rickenella mellea TaxID=50990 RepID=A0A4Y7QK44_9AGAM|nr:hypothetical protein BD410DRAFT_835828 [Rickenella mellea]